jgi:hypothetical protein
MVDLTFSYQIRYDKDREDTCRRVVSSVSEILTLPKSIHIQFSSMAPCEYGATSVDFRFRDRIRLNDTLVASEVTYVLVHELIHLNQTFTGILKVSRGGSYSWRGHSVNTDAVAYDDLPWEIDVSERIVAIMAHLG